MDRIPVGILGATGTVGQRFAQLLADHPWFEVAALAASDQSVGKRYIDARQWLLPTPIPKGVRDLVVQPVEPPLDARLVFSALPWNIAGPVEERFAAAGYAVCSNAASHRLERDVPLLIPEVNADHAALIEKQRERHQGRGFIVTNANCSSTQLVLALKPLHDRFGLRKVAVITMQAISGAGYPGIAALDILDNIIPFIAGEEEKMQREPLKMLGRLNDGAVSDASFILSAQCNRVPVRDGHTECVSVEFEKKASPEEVMEALESFQPSADIAHLPSTPAPPIIVHCDPDRPQPVRDRDAGHGMAVTVGRVRPCPLFDVKFVVLGHNTVRGAAGGAIHNAELLVLQKWVS